MGNFRFLIHLTMLYVTVSTLHVIHTFFCCTEQEPATSIAALELLDAV